MQDPARYLGGGAVEGHLVNVGGRGASKFSAHSEIFGLRVLQ
jgi:hypothetical protein